jgi:hypothetical protein
VGRVVSNIPLLVQIVSLVFVIPSSSTAETLDDLYRADLRAIPRRRPSASVCLRRRGLPSRCAPASSRCARQRIRRHGGSD